MSLHNFKNIFSYLLWLYQWGSILLAFLGPLNIFSLQSCWSNIAYPKSLAFHWSPRQILYTLVAWDQAALSFGAIHILRQHIFRYFWPPPLYVRDHTLITLKCGFCKKSFIMNAQVSSAYLFVITFGWVQQQTHPTVMADMLNWLEVHS